MTIAVIALVVTGVLFFAGTRAANVEINADGIHILGMYGTRIDFNEMTNIMLRPETMHEIGPGRRNNGSNARGVLRGRFEAGLLFTSADSAPTIQIERTNGITVFISFPDSAQTEDVYHRIREAMPQVMV